jgi:hypothetical protein
MKKNLNSIDLQYFLLLNDKNMKNILKYINNRINELYFVENGNDIQSTLILTRLKLFQ